MIKNKKEIPILIGLILIFIGTFLPSIRIAQENISFLKDNNSLMIVIVAIMYILLKLEKKEYIIIPSAISITMIIKFILDNIDRLEKIRTQYNCYAKYQYGLLIMLLGNIIILISIYIPYINFNKIKEKTKLIINKIIKTIPNKAKNIKTKIINKYTALEPKKKAKKIKETLKEKYINFKLNRHHNKKKKQQLQKTKKILTPSLIEKINKKENKNRIIKETTKDGKIKYNKITVKVDKIKEKESFKQKLNDLILRIKLKKISRKKLSITKYKEEKTNTKTYYIPRVDIKRWTRNRICCINCGATVNENSEYCFLCDCKIKLTEKEEKLS